MGHRLSEKITVITGAASGIGQAAALRFAEEGAVVILADIQETAGNQAVKKIEQAGGKADFIRVDVSQPQEVESAFGRSSNVTAGSIAPVTMRASTAIGPTP